MKKIVIPLIVLVMICGIIGTATAALVNYGNGMIYDTDLNITWLQDANYAYTSGYDADGLLNYNDAKTWAENLVYQGYSDWHLPGMPPITPLGVKQYNRTDIAFGDLYYTELGNVTGGPLSNTGPFINLQSNYYWSSNDPGDGYGAYAFDFSDGGAC